MKDAIKHGTHYYIPPKPLGKGEIHHNARLNLRQMDLVFRLREQGWTQKKIGRRVRLSQTQVSYLLRGCTKSYKYGIPIQL